MNNSSFYLRSYATPASIVFALLVLGSQCALADCDTGCCAFVDIYSDPPGAHVYGEDGNEWGQTSKSNPVVRVFSLNDSNCYDPSTKETITLQKRGYKTTQHTFTVYYKSLSCQSVKNPNDDTYKDVCDDERARSNPIELTVVLDTGDE